MTLINVLQLSPKGFQLRPLKLQIQTLTTEMTHHGLFLYSSILANINKFTLRPKKKLIQI